MKGINRTLAKFNIKDNESVSQALGTTSMSLNTLLKYIIHSQMRAKQPLLEL